MLASSINTNTPPSGEYCRIFYTYDEGFVVHALRDVTFREDVIRKISLRSIFILFLAAQYC